MFAQKPHQRVHWVSDESSQHIPSGVKSQNKSHTTKNTALAGNGNPWFACHAHTDPQTMGTTTSDAKILVQKVCVIRDYRKLQKTKSTPPHPEVQFSTPRCCTNTSVYSLPARFWRKQPHKVFIIRQRLCQITTTGTLLTDVLIPQTGKQEAV